MKMCELLIMKLFLSRSIQIKWIFSYQIMYKLWREKTPKTPWYEIVWHLVWNGSQNKNQVLREPNKLIKKNTSISWNRWTLGLKCLAPHVNWISKRYQVHLEPNKLSPNTKHEHLEGQLKQLRHHMDILKQRKVGMYELFGTWCELVLIQNTRSIWNHTNWFPVTQIINILELKIMRMFGAFCEPSLVKIPVSLWTKQFWFIDNTQATKYGTKKMCMHWSDRDSQQW